MGIFMGGVKLITTPINTGTPANFNRGNKACTGEWIKRISGDDLLTDDCIETLVNEITPEKQIIVCSIKSFYEDKAGVKHISDKIIPHALKFFFAWNAKKQYKYLLLHRPGFAPGMFVRKSVYDKVCGYDETCKRMEDLPFLLNVTKKGIKLWLSESIGAYYRVHESVSHSFASYVSLIYYQDIKRVDKEYLVRNIPWYYIAFYESLILYHFRYWVLIHVFKNKKCILGDIFSKMIGLLRIERYYNPFVDRVYRKMAKNK